MKAYKDDYGDDIPGRGNVAYDRRHDDTEIVGFLNNYQIKERYQEELDDLNYRHTYHKSVITDIKKDIRHIKTKLKSYGKDR